MFDFLKRQKLQRKGYSCGKKRREHSSSEWTEVLRTSPWVRWLIVAGFLCALVVLVRYLNADSTFQRMRPGMGMACMVALLPVSLAHFRLNLRPAYDLNSRFFLVYGLILLHLVLLHGVWFVVRLNQLQENYALLLAPVALAPMTLTLLLGKRYGAFAALYASLWGALLADWHAGLQFAIMASVTGLVSVWSVRRLRKRGELMRAGVYAGLVAFGCTILLGRVVQPWAAGIAGDSWQTLAKECGANILTGIFTAMLVGGMLPVLEAVFRVTTTISWIELADLNHPLLRRMTLEAPGTYHHSLMVANLSEAAAEAVGADATICRVCSYFHDVGKLVKPEYYIENMSGGENPHDDLTPSMSALIVIAHVKDGVDLACRHKLNREIIDVIQQHHGTSLAFFFYRKALDQQEEAKKAAAEGRAPLSDVPEVNASSFRYPGPKPSFRESAIISLADAVESASRSLTKPSPQKIETLVEEIVRARLRDGQLDECDLTLRDLRLVRDSFTKTLRTCLHRRVPYPEERERKERDESGTVTERLEERDRERPRQPQKPVAAKTVVQAAASNIIQMLPPAPIEDKSASSP